MPGEVSRSFDPEGIYPEIGDAPLCRGCDGSLTMQDVTHRRGLCRECWEEFGKEDAGELMCERCGGDCTVEDDEGRTVECEDCSGTGIAVPEDTQEEPPS